MGLVNNDKDLDDEMEAKARRKRRVSETKVKGGREPSFGYLITWNTFIFISNFD